jgi:regulator of RNase E activity RraA
VSAELASIADKFPDLSTSLVASACQQLNVGLRVAPAGIRSLRAHQRLIGRVIPVRYYGSIDVVLEALEHSNPGDVLVIDNKGRLYEACIEHLTVLEATSAGITGAVVWGVHRETDKLRALDFALFSYGSFPRETVQLRQAPPDSLAAARIGIATVTRDDVVVADSDGVLFVPNSRLGDILQAASSIGMNQSDRAGLVGKGTNLRQQFGFRRYLTVRQEDPTYTFRKHLRSVDET